MKQNGSGLTTVATVDEARKSDQLDSKITFENTKSATAAQARIIKTIKAHIVGAIRRPIKPTSIIALRASGSRLLRRSTPILGLSGRSYSRPGSASAPAAPPS
jgi:hypothetical protein